MQQTRAARSDVPGAVRARAAGISRAGAGAQGRAAARRRTQRHLVLRGPPHRAVPGAGDAARRAHLRARGHRGRARRLQPADPRRQQLESDAADRVRAARRARARARAAEGDRGSLLGAGRRRTSACSRSPTRTCERENEEKTSAVHFLRFELERAHDREPARRGGARAQASITSTTATRCLRCPRRCGRRCWPTCPSGRASRQRALRLPRPRRPDAKIAPRPRRAQHLRALAAHSRDDSRSG